VKKRLRQSRPPYRECEEVRRARGGGDQPFRLRHRGRDRGVKDYVARWVPKRSCARTGPKGSAGIEELAHKVVELAERGGAVLAALSRRAMPLLEKIETVAKIYHAAEAIADKAVRDQLDPGRSRATAICRSAWPRRSIRSRPTPTCAARHEGHVVPCARCACRPARASSSPSPGEIMTMPGLPDMNKIYPGKSVYACMLNDRGHFTDDCIVYRTGPELLDAGARLGLGPRGDRQAGGGAAIVPFSSTTTCTTCRCRVRLPSTISPSTCPASATSNTSITCRRRCSARR
jgi:hypothetical protein